MVAALARIVTAHEKNTVEGMAVGSIVRQYGLLKCSEQVTVETVFERSGDLAVADRMAFLAAVRGGGDCAVVEHDGWYYVVRLSTPLDYEQAASVQFGGDVRLLSLAGKRGIVPVVSPLVG